MRSTRQSERGAVLVHVAVGLTALLGFSALTIDYGVMWASRRQAQNSADAGALAGAVSLAFYAGVDKADVAEAAAEATAASNAVWGEAPGIVATTPYPQTCTGDASGASCIRVDAFRNGTNGGNVLPTFFGRVIGVQQQGVQAMAVAQAGVGNASDCLKPWAVVDKWRERYPTEATWTQDSTFDKYFTQGPNAGAPNPAINPPDEYIRPTANDPGTGFRPFNPDGSYTADYGRRVTLKNGNDNDFEFGAGWFMPLALADSRGGKDYENNIKGCIGVTWAIGEELDVDNEPGNKVGPTKKGVEDLIAQDRGAEWDQTMNGGRGGIRGSAFAVSPRVVAVPLVDPDRIAEANNGGRKSVPIVNIMGFFIEGYTSGSNGGVQGRLVTIPGLMATGGSSVGPESAFLMKITLIR